MSEPATAAEEARARLTEALVATGEEDRSAFTRLYSLTSAKLFGICVRICQDRQVAEDVLHEVYLTIWRRAAGYEPGRGSPMTWLSTIARNRAIDWRRSSRSRAVAPMTAASEIPDAAPSAMDQIITHEANNRLLGCMEALGADQRDAIRSAFFDGLTYAELAQSKSVPLGTMKSRVRRGLSQLKECLEDD